MIGLARAVPFTSVRVFDQRAPHDFAICVDTPQAQQVSDVESLLIGHRVILTAVPRTHLIRHRVRGSSSRVAKVALWFNASCYSARHARAAATFILVADELILNFGDSAILLYHIDLVDSRTRLCRIRASAEPRPFDCS